MYPKPKSPSRILVVGAGALGCAALRTLAGETTVRVTLVDDDRVELSNLQRQVLYEDADIGLLKVDAAASALEREFGRGIGTKALRFDEATGPSLVAQADFVIDATDDPATKFLINRLCVEAGLPFVHAGVARAGGQWLLVTPGASACLECIFPPQDATSESAAGCSALGILAPVAGFVGAMQAATALSFLVSGPVPATRDGAADAAGILSADAVPGRLHLYGLTGARRRSVDFPPRDGCFCKAAREPRGLREGLVTRRAS